MSPVLYWIKMAGIGILVFFLIIVGKLSVLTIDYVSFWACHIWLLLCGGAFLLYPFSWIFFMNRFWILSKALIFIHFVNVVYQIDLQMFNHTCNKSHLIMEYDTFNVLFNVLLYSFINILPRIFTSIIIRDIGLWFFLSMSLSGFGIREMQAS